MFDITKSNHIYIKENKGNGYYYAFFEDNKPVMDYTLHKQISAETRNDAISLTKSKYPNSEIVFSFTSPSI